MSDERFAAWCPGAEHGIAWANGVAIVSHEVDPRSVERLWIALRAGTGLGAFLELLAAVSGRDLLSLPGFAVALLADGRARTAARGGFEVIVESDEGTLHVDGSGVTTWSERHVEAVRSIEIRCGDWLAESRRPIVDGVVPAVAMFIGPPREVEAEPAGRPATDRAQQPEPEPLPAGQPGADPDPVAPEPESEAGPDLPAPEAESDPDLSNPESDPDLSNPESDPDLSEPAPAPATEDPQPEQPEQPRPVAIATPPEADLPDEHPLPGPATPEDVRLANVWSEHTQFQPVEQAAVRVEATPLFISGIPRRSATAGQAAAPAVVDLGDHDGHTILQPDLERAAPQRATPGLDAGDELSALLCHAGHANPTHRVTCRICAEPIDGEVRTVARPSLGRMTSSMGEVVELTGPVIAGRNPRASRVQGPEVPRLLSLPHGHVSASHIEIRTDGWRVLALDLQSRNGTFLRRRGQPAMRLLEKPVPLISGDVLDLGHGVRLSFEDLP